MCSNSKEKRFPILTIKHTCGDTVETLDDVTGFDYQYPIGRDNTKRNVTMVRITAETNGVRYSFGTNATAALGHLLDVVATQSNNEVILRGASEINRFTFINAVAQSNAVLMITGYIDESVGS